MNFIVVILLVGLWSFLLLPGLLRARREATPVSSVDEFVRDMDLLGRTRSRRDLPPGRQVLVLPARPPDRKAHARATAAQRRKTVLQLLGGATAAPTVLALGLGGMHWWAIAATAGLVLVGYVAVAVYVVWQQELMRRTVRPLRGDHAVPQSDPPPHEQRVAADAGSHSLDAWNGG